jgi:hypothetical protein
MVSNCLAITVDLSLQTCADNRTTREPRDVSKIQESNQPDRIFSIKGDSLPMNPKALVVCLAAAFSAAALAQSPSADTDANTDQSAHAANRGATVAYVYVSSNPRNSSTNEIVAYAAARNGKLTPLFGSPFEEDVTSMAVTGSYLFAAARQAPEIDSYRIEPDGSLHFSAASDYSRYNPDDAGFAGPVFLDHTGATLYVMEFEAYNDNNIYSSFAIDKSDGSLKYLGFANEGAPSFAAAYLEPSFIGNNVYAYTATNSDCMYFGIYGLKRESNGLLRNINLGPSAEMAPTPPSQDRAYCPQQAAADPTNHVAITLQPGNPPGAIDGLPQIASFTANESGKLTSTNASSDMPKTRVTFANDLKMSPSGKLLAVGGYGGLQVFHFNGAKPVTHYTGLLTKNTITQMFWDNDNHLYAISQAAGKLFVFTITPEGYSEAPGSPHAIGNPQNIIVRSLQLP